MNHKRKLSIKLQFQNWSQMQLCQRKPVPVEAPKVDKKALKWPPPVRTSADCFNRIPAIWTLLPFQGGEGFPNTWPVSISVASLLHRNEHHFRKLRLSKMASEWIF